MKEFVSNLFPRNTKTRVLFFLCADTFLLAVSIGVAFLLRFDGHIPALYFYAPFGMAVALVWMCVLPFLWLFRLYSLSWSYVSTRELVSLAKAMTAGFLFAFALVSFLREIPVFEQFPRSVLVIGYVVSFLVLGGLRLAKRIYFSLRPEKGEAFSQLRTVIVGAGDAAEQLVRSLQSGKEKYLPLCLVDDNPLKRGIRIHGIPVVAGIQDIPRIASRYNAEALIIALPSANSRLIRETVEFGRAAQIKEIKILPSISELMSGAVSSEHIREVGVEDLLGRDPVELDTKLIESFLRGKHVLITGAAGSIGSELSQQVLKFHPAGLSLVDNNESGLFDIERALRKRSGTPIPIRLFPADVRDKVKIFSIFDQTRPQVVFHAAAYKHVPLMEEYPDEAIKNNIFGTEIVAQTALRCKAEKFVFISTDKAVNPVSVMGMTKRIGEMLCQLYNQKGETRFISVRFGNVLESRGSVIPIFREQIQKGGPVEVTHPEMKRYFMMNSEACLLVLQASAMGNGGEVFVLDMGKPVAIVDLAKELIRLSGFEPDVHIPIVFTGTRPGEKLFEDILTAQEGTVATQHQKVFVAKLTMVNEKLFFEHFALVRERVNEGMPRDALKELLKDFGKFS